MLNASLSYEILMYLNSFYFGMFAASEISITVLKGINLQYEDNGHRWEAFLLLVLCILETIRIVLGRKCSLSDRGWQAILSAILTFPSILGVAYFLFFQKYILKFEYILCALMLTLQAAELFFALIFICAMCQPVTYT
ncbi:transmembrane protein 216 [Episyrphus balteatus]|uniref:transmembrane protein 216 n=1 Tax=Episyrphus balteatus TaxID=286459 RepID=UPI002484D86A|nr:transmembrane protein 216 [Episyrphus balteatus]